MQAHALVAGSAAAVFANDILYFFDAFCYYIDMNSKKLSIAADILKKAGCENLYLFGSQALGTADRHSDIDIGVTGLPPAQFFLVHSELENTLDMKVDLVDFDCQRSFFELLQNLGELKRIG